MFNVCHLCLIEKEGGMISGRPASEKFHEVSAILNLEQLLLSNISRPIFDHIINIGSVGH